MTWVSHFSQLQKNLISRQISIWPSAQGTMGDSKVDSAFHPSEVDKLSTRSFWELSGKK